MKENNLEEIARNSTNNPRRINWPLTVLLVGVNAAYLYGASRLFNNLEKQHPEVLEVMFPVVIVAGSAGFYLLNRCYKYGYKQIKQFLRI